MHRTLIIRVVLLSSDSWVISVIPLEGTYVVAGDSATDRMLFWNVHHRFRRGSLSDITALRVPVCAGCRREEATPVSGDWRFKADSFMIEAYRGFWNGGGDSGVVAPLGWK